MVTYFKELFTDKTAFVRAVRGLSAAAAFFIATNPTVAADMPGWVAPLLGFIAAFAKAGEQNPR